MSVIKDIDKINFKFSGTCSVNTASIDNNRYADRYKVHPYQLLYISYS